jgi:hypothetical protein
MQEGLKVSFALSAAVAVMMGIQSVAGLALQGQYRDVESIRATWFGNDWVTRRPGSRLLRSLVHERPLQSH